MNWNYQRLISQDVDNGLNHIGFDECPFDILILSPYCFLKHIIHSWTSQAPKSHVNFYASKQELGNNIQDKSRIMFSCHYLQSMHQLTSSPTILVRELPLYRHCGWKIWLSTQCPLDSPEKCRMPSFQANFLEYCQKLSVCDELTRAWSGLIPQMRQSRSQGQQTQGYIWWVAS